MMFWVLSFRRSRAAYSVVVLPEPVGPVTSRMPWGLWISSSIEPWVRASMPREFRSSLPACLSRIRSTTRSPCPEGMVETRTSTARPAIFRLMRPSCGRRFSGVSRRGITLLRGPTSRAPHAPVLRQALLGDVEARHHLDARHHERRHRAARLQHLAQHAIDTKTDHQAVLEGLDVDVGGVLLHRLGEDRVDQADDRGVVLAVEKVGLLG